MPSVFWKPRLGRRAGSRARRGSRTPRARRPPTSGTSSTGAGPCGPAPDCGSASGPLRSQPRSGTSDSGAPKLVSAPDGWPATPGLAAPYSQRSDGPSASLRSSGPPYGGSKQVRRRPVTLASHRKRTGTARAPHSKRRLADQMNLRETNEFQNETNEYRTSPMSSAPTRQPLQRLDGTTVRVLVVDDEPNLSELLSMALRFEGSGRARRGQRITGRPHRPRPFVPTRWSSHDAARFRRHDRAAPDAQRQPRDPGAVPDREGCCRGPRRWTDRRRGRLRHQAVQPRRGRGQAPRVDATHHDLSPGDGVDPRRRRPHATRTATRSPERARRFTSPPPSSNSCAF